MKNSGFKQLKNSIRFHSFKDDQHCTFFYLDEELGQPPQENQDHFVRGFHPLAFNYLTPDCKAAVSVTPDQDITGYLLPGLREIVQVDSNISDHRRRAPTEWTCTVVRMTYERIPNKILNWEYGERRREKSENTRFLR